MRNIFKQYIQVENSSYHNSSSIPFYISVPFISHTENNKCKKVTHSLIGWFYLQLDMNVVFYNQLANGIFSQGNTFLASCIAISLIDSSVASVLLHFVGRRKLTYTHDISSTKGFQIGTVSVKEYFPIVIFVTMHISNHPNLMNDFRVLSGYKR